MADPADTLREHLACVVALGDRIAAGLTAVEEFEDADLLALIPAVHSLVQAGHGLLALVAGEVARRDGGRKAPSLAQQYGYRNAKALVAARAGMSFGQASMHVAAGEIIRRIPTSDGPSAEPERPHVAEAVLAGDLSLQVALLIDDTLEALRARYSTEQLDVVEAALVEQAVSGDCTVAEFTTECKRLVARLDPAGAKDRDEALRARASIRQTVLANGLLRIVAELDPERAAYYLAAMTAKTNPHRNRTPGADGAAATGPRPLDPRTGADPHTPTPAGPQPDPTVTRLDAFVSICQDSLHADDGAQAGVDTTVLVRIDLHDLLTATGTATIDGIDTPVSAATARRMAVNGEIIPQVFGGASQLLDQGQARRLFSKAQRYAIYAGYDGCAFPACGLPLSMTQIHHVGQWATRHRHGQGTDLDNGIPLCGFHNRLMETGWDARLDPDDVPWFLPPATLDPHRDPRRGHHRPTRATAA